MRLNGLNKSHSYPANFAKKKEKVSTLKRFYLMRAAFLTGLVLSVMSYFNLCMTSACTETHKYILFGFPFTMFGFVFFPSAWISFELGRTRRALSTLFVIMIAVASGAELEFLRIQKYEIREWCPLCLGIAATVYILAFLACYGWTKNIIFTSNDRRGIIMTTLKRTSLIVLIVAAGFLLAFKGAQKGEAQDKAMNIFLGAGNSVRELYIFTDWFCPACRKAEPEIEKAVSSLEKNTKIIFVDVPIHPETLNYMPYNLSFLTNEKGKYLELRKALGTLSLTSKEPPVDEVQKTIAPLGVTYKPLSFMIVTKGLKYWDETAKSFGVKSTPTVVAANKETKKKIQMVGFKDITEQNIMKALDEVSK